tara:strand:- start:189 stop:314 length:126 start_codon:yes stop_codon:yes gene_type:complete
MERIDNMRKYLNNEEQVDYIIIGIAIGFGLGLAFSFFWVIP